MAMLADSISRKKVEAQKHNKRLTRETQLIVKRKKEPDRQRSKTITYKSGLSSGTGALELLTKLKVAQALELQTVNMV